MKRVKAITEPPDSAYCPHCECERTKEELVCVPKDDLGKPHFIGCRVCNRKTEQKGE